MTDTIIVLQNEREEAGTMILKEKERTTIEDLQTQEKSCIEKYFSDITAERERTL